MSKEKIPYEILTAKDNYGADWKILVKDRVYQDPIEAAAIIFAFFGVVIFIFIGGNFVTTVLGGIVCVGVAIVVSWFRSLDNTLKEENLLGIEEDLKFELAEVSFGDDSDIDKLILKVPSERGIRKIELIAGKDIDWDIYNAYYSFCTYAPEYNLVPWRIKRAKRSLYLSEKKYKYLASLVGVQITGNNLVLYKSPYISKGYNQTIASSSDTTPFFDFYDACSSIDSFCDAGASSDSSSGDSSGDSGGDSGGGDGGGGGD